MALEFVIGDSQVNNSMLQAGELEVTVNSTQAPKPKVNEISAQELTAEQQSLIRSLVLRTLNDTLQSKYFADIAEKKATIYYVGNFEGVAITYMTKYGILLDILAVENPNKGIGSRLFNHVLAKSDGLVFCRSQPFRGYKDWYSKRTDRMETFPNVQNTPYDHFFKEMSQSQIVGACELFRNKLSNYEPRAH